MTFRNLLAAAAVGLSLTAVIVAQSAPTEATRAGSTSVRLSQDFLGALTTLKVAPAALSLGRAKTKEGVFATFPITAGAVDLGTVKAEIDHSGGLSLTAGATRVELSAFIIDLAGTGPVLTGLVTVNDSLLARVPLFDLALPRGSVRGNDDFLKVAASR